MLLRRFGVLAFASLFTLAACGGSGGDGEESDTVQSEEMAADEGEAEGDAPEEVPDSIPMQVTVTVTGHPNMNKGGGEFIGGTFTSNRKGVLCMQYPDVRADAIQNEWMVHWSNPDDPNLQLVQLGLGKTVNGTTNRMTAMFAAGRVKVGGTEAPVMENIGTYDGGMKLGSGTARVTRQGDGVRIDFDLVGGNWKTGLKGTVVCERLGDIT
jgi:hypothetical protein